ncbi:MAG: DUF5317 family protein [Thermoleophilia bacterium]|nr:DUF5317 family protein [Thermoleophilia bacterium]
MFVLAGVAIGLFMALALGGRPSRITSSVRFRYPWLVFFVLALQGATFLGPAALREGSRGDVLYLLSLALLLVFAAENLEVRSILPVFAGMLCNSIAIAANGGTMPVAPGALREAGIAIDAGSNIGVEAPHLRFLGDIFALPAGWPVANVFSIGDILIVGGTALFIVLKSFDSELIGVIRPQHMLAPLRVSGYRRLALATLVSRIGDWLTVAALIGWIYERTQSTGHVAAVMLIRLAPPIVGGGVAALVVDRFAKERLLASIEVMRGLAVLVALSGVASGRLVVVFAALAASGLLAAVSAVGVPSIVPELLEEKDLGAANAGLGVSQDAALALGALTAGITLSSTNVGVALVADAATFALAACLYLVLSPRGLAVARSAEREGERLGIVTGLRYIAQRRILVTVLFTFAVATLATGLANATLPSFLAELDLGAGAYGFALAALGAGLVLGEAFTGIVRIGQRGTRWMPVALALMAVAFAALASTGHVLTAFFFLGVIGFLDGTTDVLFDTIVQRETEGPFLGRVFGLGSAFFTTTMMFAVASAPLLTAVAAPDRVLLLAGGFALVAALVAGFGLRSGRRPVPAAADPPGAAVAR